MEQHATIDVSVQISQTMRDLRAGRATAGQARRYVAAQTSMPPVGPHAPSVRSATTWARICLRNDGTQPLVFEGLPIVRFTGPLSLGPVMGQQSIALYRSKTGVAYASLSWHCPSDVAIRSMFRAHEIGPTNAPQLLSDWCRALCEIAHRVTPSSSPADRLTAIFDQIQSMTSGSFGTAAVS